MDKRFLCVNLSKMSRPALAELYEAIVATPVGETDKEAVLKEIRRQVKAGAS